jgi:hypothetical protein
MAKIQPTDFGHQASHRIRLDPGDVLLRRLAEDIACFTSGAVQNDDMTALLIRRLAV